tara:strand:+ start:3634 stop:3876 length:243 start_codon:yes stop_codon:yes gene_type:complete
MTLETMDARDWLISIGGTRETGGVSKTRLLNELEEEYNVGLSRCYKGKDVYLAKGLHIRLWHEMTDDDGYEVWNAVVTAC